MAESIPEGINQKHIEGAIAALDAGEEHKFAPSVGYDLIFRGKAYAPKAVLGMAAKQLTGEALGPYDFKGGLKSKCFRILEQNGFEIVAKPHGNSQPRPAGRRLWGEEELRASVEAYVDMLRKEAQGESFSKAIYYEELSGRFDRTAKALEFRMQNISYVYSLMGRRWVGGLLPAKNVGWNVIQSIEAHIRAIEGIVLPPIEEFDSSGPATKGEASSTIPPGKLSPTRSATQVTQFARDKDVVNYVLAVADGVCESCGMQAPFKRRDGSPYLEVHHIRRLADGGSDTVTNAIALCPNCHRNFHYGENVFELAESMYSRVKRLVRE